jgi:hypothetical protein
MKAQRILSMASLHSKYHKAIIPRQDLGQFNFTRIQAQFFSPKLQAKLFKQSCRLAHLLK